MSTKFKVTLGIIIVILITIIALGNNIVSWNDAGQTLVTQYPNGKIKVVLTPGPYWQAFGQEFEYNHYATIGFGTQKGDRSADIAAVPVIFNDASTAGISLLARVQMPQDEVKMSKIKQQFVTGYSHFLTAGAVPVIENIVKISANLRSSQEAFQTMSQFKTDIETQLRDGQYVTKAVEKWVTKATGDSERVKLTEIVYAEDGVTPLTTTHDLKEMGCKVTIQVLEVPDFDKRTKDMIAQRKEQSLQTEVRKQEAIRAEQEAITAEASGKAEAMKVKWEQEKEKAKEVTMAEKRKEVAKLDMESAAFKKKADILEGEGIAAKKKLIMQADGALELKLKAAVEINKNYATAIQNFQGNLVPQYISGNADGKSSSAMDLIEMLKIKTAKDLSLDMSTKK